MAGAGADHKHYKTSCLNSRCYQFERHMGPAEARQQELVSGGEVADEPSALADRAGGKTLGISFGIADCQLGVALKLDGADR